MHEDMRVPHVQVSDPSLNKQIKHMCINYTNSVHNY